MVFQVEHIAREDDACEFASMFDNRQCAITVTFKDLGGFFKGSIAAEVYGLGAGCVGWCQTWSLPRNLWAAVS
jgi:hypothetical protein